MHGSGRISGQTCKTHPRLHRSIDRSLPSLPPLILLCLGIGCAGVAFSPVVLHTRLSYDCQAGLVNCIALRHHASSALHLPSLPTKPETQPLFYQRQRRPQNSCDHCPRNTYQEQRAGRSQRARPRTQDPSVEGTQEGHWTLDSRLHRRF